MRVKGNIRVQWVTILVDIVSTYNFLDPIIVNKLQLLLDYAEKVKVREFISGEMIPSERKCNGVRVKIQGITFRVEVHVLVLASYDMELGIHWL